MASWNLQGLHRVKRIKYETDKPIRKKCPVSQGVWEFLGSAVMGSRFYLLPLGPSLSLPHWAHTSPHTHLTRGHFCSLGPQEGHMCHRGQFHCPMPRSQPLSSGYLLSLWRELLMVFYFGITPSASFCPPSTPATIPPAGRALQF